MAVGRVISLICAVVFLPGCTVVAVVDHLSNPAEIVPESPVSAADAKPDDLPPVSEETVPLSYTAGMGIDDAALVFSEALKVGGAGDGQIKVANLLESLEDFGFSQESVETTAELSQVKLPVDSVSLGVPIGEECIIGQVSKSWLVVEIETQFSDGSCIIQGTERSQ